MEPETEPLDLSVLDPARDSARWDRTIARVADRARELRRLRRMVARRGAVAVMLAAAAALALWFTAPRRHPVEPTRSSILDWAVRDVEPNELLEIGGGDAY